MNKYFGSWDNVQLHKDLTVNEPFVLFTYTTGFGEVPISSLEFARHNSTYLKGVVCSGNLNWGKNYALAGVKLSQLYNVPLLHQFELSGKEKDYNIIIERLKEICLNEQ